MEEINNFQQESDETLYQAWELLRTLKWHNRTSKGRSNETSDGLNAIQAQLNNLGREIKKVNEKVYVAQVICEQCKGPHYTKDCPQKKEGKTLVEAYYTQFGGPFKGGGYRATAPGYYQRNNANPSFQERRESMEETLNKFMNESAKRHEENSNLIKKSNFRRMLKKEPKEQSNQHFRNSNWANEQEQNFALQAKTKQTVPFPGSLEDHYCEDDGNYGPKFTKAYRASFNQ
ncbi:hypothetical protein Tco_1283251 [Tanacetum coccineum]